MNGSKRQRLRRARKHRCFWCKKQLGPGWQHGTGAVNGKRFNFWCCSAVHFVQCMEAVRP